ncbi:MAG: helix-turn-helix domain-containing protein [Clostridiales bacterium]|nr:helix-turn-helix domain-containing protein [Clostridiales bacterium]
MYFDAVKFGKRIQEVRRERGLTQEELADRLRLSSKQYISRIERGECACSIDLLVELVCALHISADYLLMGKESGCEHIKDDLLSVVGRLAAIANAI